VVVVRRLRLQEAEWAVEAIHRRHQRRTGEAQVRTRSLRNRPAQRHSPAGELKRRSRSRLGRRWRRPEVAALLLRAQCLRLRKVRLRLPAASDNRPVAATDSNRSLRPRWRSPVEWEAADMVLRLPHTRLRFSLRLHCRSRCPLL